MSPVQAGGEMKVDDMVIRKRTSLTASGQRKRLSYGLILSKQMGGRNPVHPCLTVFYTKTGQVYDIAESLVEVISETK